MRKLINMYINFRNSLVSDKKVIENYQDCMRFIDLFCSPTDGKLSEQSALALYPFIAKLNIIIPEMKRRGIYEND
ncbi:hypothetical protein NVP1076O_16 [Vibrio phage 1.076.O._10N.286.51.B7]|nr:hypothetical protein NVP1076O_16 [Vibrio phage 1.076.O._10N.286.51.B7]